MRIGSLFSGAGGLDLAVQAVFGGEVVWHAEIDKAASKVLAHRFPGVPNLGDITQVNWENWKPALAVDVLCGGFPCQDVSAAGKRAGIKDGTRSGLWAVFADAIDALRPQWVVIENVRGLLSATAHRTVEDDEQSGDMESPTAAMGNGSDRPVLRAAGAVLGDLADLGYDAQWTTFAAADVGAPHRRERVFIVAYAAGVLGASVSSGYDATALDAAGLGAGCGDRGGDSAAGVQQLGRSARCKSGDGTSGDEPGVALLPTPTQSDGTGGGIRTGLSWEGTTKSTGDGGNSRLRDVAGLLGPLLPTPRSSDCFGAGQHGDGGMDLRTTISLLPTPNAVDGHPRGGARHSTKKHPTLNGEARLVSTNWGKYEPAICRWEAIVGPAPAPTEPNKNGNPRLSAAFSEWLMGWPAGWVTDPAIGISRNDQLRIVGNGVCPQQAVAALRFLLGVSTGTHTHTAGVLT